MGTSWISIVAVGFFLVLPCNIQTGKNTRSISSAPRTDIQPCKTELTSDSLSKIHGRIQFVNSFPDYKVKVVTAFEDVRVQVVKSFPDKPGKWQIVDSHPEYKIQLVENYPDFTIRYVEDFPGVR